MLAPATLHTTRDACLLLPQECSAPLQRPFAGYQGQHLLRGEAFYLFPVPDSKRGSADVLDGSGVPLGTASGAFRAIALARKVKRAEWSP